MRTDATGSCGPLAKEERASRVLDAAVARRSVGRRLGDCCGAPNESMCGSDCVRSKLAG